MKLLRFDHGYWDVEHNGQTFRVFMACLNPGMEYLVNGCRWLDEKHPLVLAMWSGDRAERPRA